MALSFRKLPLPFFILLKIMSGQQLPSDVKKCDSILASNLNYIIGHYSKGISEIGMAPIKSFKIESGELNPENKFGIKMYAKHYNTTINGLEKTNITKVSGLNKDETDLSKMEVNGEIPLVVAKGRYQLSFTKLSANYSSSGDFMAEFQNVRFKIVSKPTIENRNGRRYLKLKDIKLYLEPDYWKEKMKADDGPTNSFLGIIKNVFSGDLINFWDFVEAPINRMFTKVLSEYIHPIFEKVPYDDFFLRLK